MLRYNANVMQVSTVSYLSIVHNVGRDQELGPTPYINFGGACRTWYVYKQLVLILYSQFSLNVLSSHFTFSVLILPSLKRPIVKRVLK